MVASRRPELYGALVDGTGMDTQHAGTQHATLQRAGTGAHLSNLEYDDTGLGLRSGGEDDEHGGVEDGEYYDGTDQSLDGSEGAEDGAEGGDGFGDEAGGGTADEDSGEDDLEAEAAYRARSCSRSSARSELVLPPRRPSASATASTGATALIAPPLAYRAGPGGAGHAGDAGGSSARAAKLARAKRLAEERVRVKEREAADALQAPGVLGTAPVYRNRTASEDREDSIKSPTDSAREQLIDARLNAQARNNAANTLLNGAAAGTGAGNVAAASRDQDREAATATPGKPKPKPTSVATAASCSPAGSAVQSSPGLQAAFARMHDPSSPPPSAGAEPTRASPSRRVVFADDIDDGGGGGGGNTAATAPAAEELLGAVEATATAAARRIAGTAGTNAPPQPKAGTGAGVATGADNGGGGGAPEPADDNHAGPGGAGHADGDGPVLPAKPALPNRDYAGDYDGNAVASPPNAVAKPGIAGIVMTPSPDKTVRPRPRTSPASTASSPVKGGTAPAAGGGEAQAASRYAYPPLSARLFETKLGGWERTSLPCTTPPTLGGCISSLHYPPLCPMPRASSH